MIPSNLNDWNYDIIKSLCQAGHSESERHDFKYSLSDLKEPEKICCAFANTNGGFIIVGVKQKNKIFNIEGLEPNSELYGDFIKKIKIEPMLEISPPNVISIPDSKNKIYVFEIPKSPKRPHIPSQTEKRYFYKRHGSNCTQMTLEEIRYQIYNYEEKKDKLTLILIELSNIQDLLSSEENMTEGAYSGIRYNFDIIDRALIETYSFLKDELSIVLMLNKIKNHISHLNSQKSFLISILTMSYGHDYKIKIVNEYREAVRQYKPFVDGAISSINELLFDKFGITNPYNMID